MLETEEKNLRDVERRKEKDREEEFSGNCVVQGEWAAWLTW